MVWKSERTRKVPGKYPEPRGARHGEQPAPCERLRDADEARELPQPLPPLQPLALLYQPPPITQGSHRNCSPIGSRALSQRPTPLGLRDARLGRTVSYAIVPCPTNLS